jgi:hypothetical protein
MGLLMRGMISLILDKASLTFSHEGVQELVDTYEIRRNSFLKNYAPAPKGSYFAWLPVRKGYTSGHLLIRYWKNAKFPWVRELDLVSMERPMVE